MATMSLTRLCDAHADEATHLFLAAYERERASGPHLPSVPLGRPEAVREEVAAMLRTGAAGAIDRGRLVAYLSVGHLSSVRGLRETRDVATG